MQFSYRTTRGEMKAIEPLTARQRQVFDFIAGSIRDKGFPPSLQEIGKAISLTSLATVHKHVSVLARKGWIHRRFNHSRAIVLTMQTGCCPTCGRETNFTAGEEKA